MKRGLAVIAALGAIFLVVWSIQLSPPTKQDLPYIGITQIATHPALDEVRQGIIDGLAEQGYVDKKTVQIHFRNANGDPSLALPIAQQFVRDRAAVIVPISTPSTLAVAQTTQSVPIVFSGVTDPVSVGLVKSLDRPGGNITGVSDRWPFEQQVRTFLRYFPTAKKIGILYKKGDDVSKVGVDALTKLAPELGYELELRVVSSAGDIYPSAAALFKDVDAIYTGIDHLILENMDGLVRASTEAGKPLFGGESGSVELGAVMALSINMHDFGVLTSSVVAKVLGGEDVGSIPIATVSSGELLVNRKAAERFGLDVDKLISDGAKIYE